MEDSVYIIVQYSLNDNTSRIHSVYTKKPLAKREVDKINAMYEDDENVDFKLETYRITHESDVRDNEEM